MVNHCLILDLCELSSWVLLHANSSFRAQYHAPNLELTPGRISHTNHVVV